MKKIYVILLVIAMVTLLLQACVSEGENMIEFETGVYFDKNWNELVGTYNGIAIPDKEKALNVAVAIFNGMNKGENVSRYTAQSIFYDEEDEVWIVSFWENSKENVIGEDCSIALQKKDGKVLRIWFGE